jgi:hypothetical protein
MAEAGEHITVQENERQLTTSTGTGHIDDMATICLPEQTYGGRGSLLFTQVLLAFVP